MKIPLQVAFLFTFLFALIPPAHSQNEIIADSLEWTDYYPLQIGNVWEWSSEIQVAYSRLDYREIIGDTLIEDALYFVQIEHFGEYDPVFNIDNSGSNTSYLRYDSLEKRVVAWRETEELEVDYSCNLNASFGGRTDCERVGDSYVEGGYESNGELLVGDDLVPYGALKMFINLGGGVSYYHGIGFLPLLGDGQAGSITFTYVRLNGVEYGDRVFNVSVEEGSVARVEELEIYPNPGSGRLTINGKSLGEVSIRMFDVMGRAVREDVSCRFPCNIDTTDLSSGIYFVRTSHAINSRTMIKQVVIGR